MARIRETLLDAAVPNGSTAPITSKWMSLAGTRATGAYSLQLETDGDVAGTWSLQASNAPGVFDGGEASPADVSAASGVYVVTGASSQFLQQLLFTAGALSVKFSPTSGSGNVRCHVASPSFGDLGGDPSSSRRTILSAAISDTNPVASGFVPLLRPNVSLALTTTGSLQGHWAIKASNHPNALTGGDPNPSDITNAFMEGTAVTTAFSQLVECRPLYAGALEVTFIPTSGVGTATANLNEAS